MKRFNITGTCYPDKHFMVDTADKLHKILGLVFQGDYFTINRPRQYGKTTTISLLQKKLLEMDEYLPIKISFDGIGDTPFLSEANFCPDFLDYLSYDIAIKKSGFSELFLQKMDNCKTFKQLSRDLSEIIEKINRKIVLIIDEVDKSSNNLLFIHFIGMLRDKFLVREDGYATFHSVILVGVNDVKTLKMKLRAEEVTSLNSPWNIAVDFDVDMSFNPTEIATMIDQYKAETRVKMDTKEISERIYFWTNGYPFLVSRLCKTVDEKIKPIPNSELKGMWKVDDIDEAVKILLKSTNTLFDVFAKYLEDYPDLSDFLQAIIFGSKEFSFQLSVTYINLAYVYGFIKQNGNGKIKIYNKIFEEYFTDHFIAKKQFDSVKGSVGDVTQSLYMKPNGRLNFEKVLLKFQEVIKEKYTETKLLENDKFLEEDLRILFLVFLKPIINGIGFSFKEVQTGEEKRLDVIVVFRDEKFVVELKMWR